MSGLIFGGMVQGLGNAGASYGSHMTQTLEQQELLRQRMEDARQLARENNAARDDRSAASDDARMERLLAKAGVTGQGAGGSLTPGTPAFAQAANEMAMSEPELERFLLAKKTGDRSTYDKVTGADVEGTPYKEETSRETPAGLDKYFEAKSATLLKIQKDFSQGKDRENIAKGRAVDQTSGVIQGVIDGTVKAPAAAEVIAAGKGDGAYGKGNVNQFTGNADEVGKSVITENINKGTASLTGAKDQTLQSLTQERISADKSVDEAAKELTRLRTDMKDMGPRDRAAQTAAIELAKTKLARYEAERDSLKTRIRDFTTTTPSGRGKLAESTPAPSGTVKPTSTPIAALPAGAKQVGTSGGYPVYQTPDGKKFIQR